DRLDGPSADRLDTALQCAAAGLVDVRGLIAALAPGGLHGASLAEALERVCRRGGTDPVVAFAVRGRGRASPVTAPAGRVRLSRGAVSSVVRHARASRGGVELVSADDEVRLTVGEVGIGFAFAMLTAAGAQTFGLGTLRRRVP